MRVLSYLVLLLMFSVASAQTPTILQGDYISNVFGNSNFILNPNAQTSNCTTSGTITCANVTVTNASITRVTTTPLVARTEFNVAITSANGTATWATRAFDAGMKGQNCEARFTYRGFAATSKVHIKQGANTVASLNLTPATDPRIASINFPCGDLSTATTFVVTDTAILAGTNEIGAIYTGLATNQANVAQAELVGTWTMSGATNCSFSTTSTSYGSPSNYSTADADCNNPVVTGDIISKGKVLGFDLPAKPGKYVILVQAPMRRTAGGSGAYFRLSDGTTNSGNQLIYSGTIGEVWSFNSITLNTEYSTAGTKTFFLDGKVDGSGSGAAVENAGADNKVVFLAYRFPTSSELVVTPERQNTFAGVVYTAENQTLFSGVAEPTAFSAYNNATWNKPLKLVGKAAVTTTGSGNDLGFSVPNLPVGSYKVTLSGALNAVSPTLGQVAVCNFRVRETTLDNEVVKYSHQSYNVSSYTTRDLITASSGVFRNTAVATRNFILEANKLADDGAGNLGICEAFSSSSSTGTTYNSQIAIVLEPLDQPSNSALYVQGPVLGAATGAAIPEGYVNEFATRRITDTANRNVSVALGAWYYPWSGTLTLPAGNWNICYRVAAQMFQNRSAVNVTQWYTRIHNQTDDTTIMANLNWPTYDNNTTHVEGSLNTHSGCQPISITSSKVFRVGLLAQPLLGVPTGVILALRGDLILSELYAIRLN